MVLAPKPRSETGMESINVIELHSKLSVTLFSFAQDLQKLGVYLELGLFKNVIILNNNLISNIDSIIGIVSL